MLLPTILDIETAPLLEVMDYFEEDADIHAPKNWKDPVLIAEYVEKEQARQREAHIDHAALDPDLCRIVALGSWYLAQAHPCLWLCMTEEDERTALEGWWGTCRDGDVLCGFNLRAFDLAVIYRRSLYLDVQTKFIDRDRYRSTRIIDVFELLNEGRRNQMHSLDWYARRFGITCEIVDTISGADVPACVARGTPEDWEKVRAHLLADLTKVKGLAARVGILQAEKAVA